MNVAGQALGNEVWTAPPSGSIGVDTVDHTLLGGGEDLLCVLEKGYEAVRDFFAPASRQVETVADRFAGLASQWKAETAMMSSVCDFAMHPAYQRIIGLGHDAVPLLLRELALRPDHWFWALKVISNVDPVPPSDRGNVRKMTEAWLRWGREQGYEIP